MSRSSAHWGSARLHGPRSSITRPKIFSVRFTQQPSRWTIFTDVQPPATEASRIKAGIRMRVPLHAAARCGPAEK